MKRLILPEKGIVELIETEIPTPKSQEVQLKVIACGICGTDKYYYTQADKPVINWGHEVLGEIVGCGENVSPALLGRKVLTKTTNPCGQCKFCLRGEFHKCQGWSRLGYNGFSEYLTLPPELVLDLPEKDFCFEYVLAEPLNVALDLVKKVQTHGAKTDEILVSGLGPIGLMVIFLLTKAGFTNLYAFGRNERTARNKLALDWGAKEIFLKLTGQYDLGVITTPYKTVADFAQHICYGGTIIYNGIHEEHNVLLNLHQLHFQKISLIPSFPHPQTDFTEVVSIIAEHRAELSRLISHKVPLAEGAAGFALYEREKQDVVKIVITE